MDLTTIDRVRTLMESSGASTGGLSSLISQVIRDVSARVEEHLGRAAFITSRTEWFDTELHMRGVLLEAFPVLDTPAPVITYAADRDFANADPLPETVYTVDHARGIVRFDRWYPDEGPRSLQVVYTGGLATSTQDAVKDYPVIAHAVDLQVTHLIQRRRALGATGESVGGGSISAIGAYDLLPEVANIINLYRRRMV